MKDLIDADSSGKRTIKSTTHCELGILNDIRRIRKESVRRPRKCQGSKNGELVDANKDEAEVDAIDEGEDDGFDEYETGSSEEDNDDEEIEEEEKAEVALKASDAQHNKDTLQAVGADETRNEVIESEEEGDSAIGTEEEEEEAKESEEGDSEDLKSEMMDADVGVSNPDKGNGDMSPARCEVKSSNAHKVFNVRSPPAVEATNPSDGRLIVTQRTGKPLELSGQSREPSSKPYGRKGEYGTRILNHIGQLPGTTTASKRRPKVEGIFLDNGKGRNAHEETKLRPKT
ncbi:hypothetical protein U1Q18_036244 [Sarracenia purpurea var. burkii]